MVNNSNSEDDGSDHVHICLHDYLFYWQVKIARKPILHGLENSSRSRGRHWITRIHMYFLLFRKFTFLGLGHRPS